MTKERKAGWLLIMLSLVQPGCEGEGVPDCFQSAGEISREAVAVPPFTGITAFENIKVVLRQEPGYRVEVETGEYLRPEISVQVEGETLVLRNSNSCNLVREYGLTTVYVSAPELREIRSSTGYPIRSEGILSYEDLSLFSESFNNPDAKTTDGSFELQLSCRNLSLVANGIAYFRLWGETEEFRVTIGAGDSRVEAEGLQAQQVYINHRGSNDIRVFPQLSLEGVIRGTGDVISYHRPAVVSVDEIYRGRLLYID